MLQYQFVIWHWPARMMWECDRLSRYKKSTESWRDNDLYNAPTEVSLEEHSVMLKERAYHLPVVLFTKYNMDADKPVPVVNLPTVWFIGGLTR